MNVSTTRTAVIYDLTDEKEVANVRLHVVADEFEDNEKYNVSSVWQNKDFDFSQFRKEESGKTYFDFQEGSETSQEVILAELDEWNTLAGVNQIELIIV